MNKVILPIYRVNQAAIINGDHFRLQEYLWLKIAEITLTNFVISILLMLLFTFAWVFIFHIYTW